MFDYYSVLCFVSFILLLVWFLFTPMPEETVQTTTPPRSKKTCPHPPVISEVVDECVGAVEDAASLQEEINIEREAMINKIRRRLKPSVASSVSDSSL